MYEAKTAKYPPMRQQIEPNFVVHRRLHFEEKNSERYGWDLGWIQPMVSTGYFFKDVLLWPNHLVTGLCNPYSTGAGKCLPGDPVPYYLYPPELSLTGTAFEGVLITGIAFIIP